MNNKLGDKYIVLLLVVVLVALVVVIVVLSKHVYNSFIRAIYYLPDIYICMCFSTFPGLLAMSLIDVDL